MRRQIILGFTLIMVGCLIEAQPGIADGALAIAMPVWGDPSQGFHYSVKAGASDADTVASAVMSDCRAADNPKIGAACRLIRSFRDQCVALAVNGDAADTNVHDAPLIGAGWAIATDTATATSVAIAECDRMRKGRQKACQIMGQVRCDGTAR
jgi:hypothetical protein